MRKSILPKQWMQGLVTRITLKRSLHLTTNGVKYDAVLLKAYDKNDSEIYLIGQKFRPKTASEDFEQIGNPGFLETELNHYNPANRSSSKKPWWKVW